MDNKVEELKINREIFCQHCGVRIVTAYHLGEPTTINCPKCDYLITIDFRVPNRENK